ncbi:ABC transporter substrate-binding protein [Aliarcobacter skirrowii]|uniref:Tgt2/MlaC family protein n=1 Tax=Aliarcobacter skirrowii TaxID=28200 RepID=UPI0021B1AF2A|nr:ABC transporter substrate-binding protein [Aliarcobacter skirrowii]MCT7447297.1 ABC transporter substrate-binding protein [Aliarcobacter skirrowii]MDX4071242.1 ABC transporter substrate-binding protein [Aliarcobacter skirrowii]
MLLKANFLKFSLLMFLFVSNLKAIQKEQIVDVMTQKIDSVISILKDTNIDLEQKKVDIINVVNNVFDFELMARISLGKEIWDKLSNEEQIEFVKTFEYTLKRSYTNKLELYTNQKVKIIALEPYFKTRLQLKTELIGSDGNYTINYNFYEKNGDWLIYDIDLVGVSIIQTYRQQFAELFKEKDFPQILAMLKEQK